MNTSHMVQYYKINQMKKSILVFALLLVSVATSAQFVAKREIKTPIKGICDANEVYALFPMLKGQEEAKCPVSDNEILKRLNSEVQFLKDNPKYKDKGMVGLIVNCKGEVVLCEMDNKTKSPELDKQMVAVFNSLDKWKPGKLNGQKVDSSILFSFQIKKGVVKFD